MVKLPAGPFPLRARWAALMGLVFFGGAFLAAACGASPSSVNVAHLSTTTTGAGGSAGTSLQAVGGSTLGGGSGPGPGQSSFSMVGGDPAQMLAFAQCVRAHGVPNFPDPNAQGAIQGTGINMGSPAFVSANKACRHLIPNGGQPTPAEQAQAMAQALKLSQCMRSHGITDFPDPQAVAGGGIRISLRGGPGSDLDPNKPQFQAAQKACQGFSPLPRASAKP